MNSKEQTILSKILHNIEEGVDYQANSNLENREHIQSASNNSVSLVKGKRHKDGGVNVDLEDGDKVLSNKLKPSKEQKGSIEEIFGIKANRKDTYSKILEKIDTKIGLKKISKEQESLLKKVEKNEKIDDVNTQEINAKLISDKMGALEQVKSQLNIAKSDAFDILYDMQEYSKGGENVKNESEQEVFDGGGEKDADPMRSLVDKALSNIDKMSGTPSKEQYVDEGYERGTLQNVQYNPEDMLAKRHNVWFMPTEQKGRISKALKGVDFDVEKGIYVDGDGNPVDEKYWDNQSLVATNYYKQYFGSLADFDAGYDKIYQESIKGVDFSKMKGSERKAFWDKMQAQRQNYFTDKYPNTAREVAMSGAYPATNQSVKYLYSEINKKPISERTDAEKNILSYLKNKKVVDDKGNVRGGYFTQQGGNDTAEFYENVRGLNQNMQDGFVKSLINDGKIDRRMEHFEKLDFGSVTERDAYAKKYGMKQVIEKDGSINWLAPNNPTNIYKPRVFRKQYTDEAGVKSWEEQPTYVKFGEEEYKGTDIPGVYALKTTRPTEATPSAKEEGTPAQEKEEIIDRPRLGSPISQNIPSAQRRAPGDYIPPMLIAPEVRDETYIKVSPEKAIVENQRSLEYMNDAIRNSQNGVQDSVLSNLSGKVFEGNNQAVSSANQLNAQARNRYDSLISNRLDRNDAARELSLANYQMLANKAADNTLQSWNNYYDDMEDDKMLAYKTRQDINYFEAATPDINYNPYTGSYDYNPFSYEVDENGNLLKIGQMKKDSDEENAALDKQAGIKKTKKT